MSLAVHTLLPDQDPLWDAFVDRSPQGSVFCYSWWLGAITKGNFRILAVFRNDEIVAGIPLAYYLGKINEPPLTRTLGPVFTSQGPRSAHDRTTLERKWLDLLLDQIPLVDVELFCTSHNFTEATLSLAWTEADDTLHLPYRLCREN